MKLADKKIYLASKSPRRRELLRQIGIDFELLLNDKEVDEQVLPDEKPIAPCCTDNCRRALSCLPTPPS